MTNRMHTLGSRQGQAVLVTSNDQYCAPITAYVSIFLFGLSEHKTLYINRVVPKTQPKQRTQSKSDTYLICSQKHLSSQQIHAGAQLDG